MRPQPRLSSRIPLARSNRPPRRSNNGRRGRRKNQKDHQQQQEQRQQKRQQQQRLEVEMQPTRAASLKSGKEDIFKEESAKKKEKRTERRRAEKMLETIKSQSIPSLSIRQEPSGKTRIFSSSRIPATLSLCPFSKKSPSQRYL